MSFMPLLMPVDRGRLGKAAAGSCARCFAHGATLASPKGASPLSRHILISATRATDPPDADAVACRVILPFQADLVSRVGLHQRSDDVQPAPTANANRLSCIFSAVSAIAILTCSQDHEHHR